jgi:ferredoxin-like protein FixX
MNENPQFSCCDNPTVTFVREESVAPLQASPDAGGKRRYHKCLNCGTDHIVTHNNEGILIDYKTSQ